MQQTYYEAETAAWYIETGFSIRFSEEVGIRGQDFDFIATRNGCEIHVEVTEITKRPIRWRTVYNRLHEKRTQFTDKQANIIHCSLPSLWSNHNFLQFMLMKATFLFFHRTRRINAVFYTIQSGTMVGEGIAFLLISFPFVNSSARVRINTDFLFCNEPSERSRDAKIKSLIKKHDLESYLKNRGYVSDFSFALWTSNVVGMQV